MLKHCEFCILTEVPGDVDKYFSCFSRQNEFFSPCNLAHHLLWLKLFQSWVIFRHTGHAGMSSIESAASRTHAALLLSLPAKTTPLSRNATHRPIIGAAGAMLLKARNAQMSAVQYLVGLSLFLGRTRKKVCFKIFYMLLYCSFQKHHINSPSVQDI